MFRQYNAHMLPSWPSANNSSRASQLEFRDDNSRNRYPVRHRRQGRSKRQADVGSTFKACFPNARDQRELYNSYTASRRCHLFHVCSTAQSDPTCCSKFISHGTSHVGIAIRHSTPAVQIPRGQTLPPLFMTAGPHLHLTETYAKYLQSIPHSLTQELKLCRQ